jgi:hypothetical protein
MYRRILLQVFILLWAGLTAVQSQPDPDRALELNVRVAPEFEAVNLENLITLTFSNQNNRPVLFYEISNPEGSGDVEFLMETRIVSEMLGTILESTQNPNTRLLIRDGQTMRFTNIDIIWGTISGQAVRPRFDFRLTSEGRNLLNKLNSGAVPDADIFSVEVSLLRAGNSAAELVSSETELETNIPRLYQTIGPDPSNQAFLRDLDLDEQVPEFRWSGPDSQRYRLIVVKADSRQQAGNRLYSRFAEAFNPDRFHEPGDNIILDVVTGNRTFVAGNDLSSVFEPGSQYYWQVGTTITTVRSEREVRSDVWEFTTKDVIIEELITLLSFLLGEERVQQMIQEGYVLDQIELGGETYTAEEAVEVLREMRRKIENRRATIGE